MKKEALPIGAKLIAQEAELDRAFADHSISPDSLKAAIAAIAFTQGELRETHLKYHLSTIALLTDDRRHQYSELRGYGDRSMTPMHHHN